MPQRFGNDDERDDLAALDFYGADETDAYHDGVAESDALDFSVADDDSDAETPDDAWETYAPAEPEDTGAELAAIDSQTEAVGEEEEDDEDHDAQLFAITNPAGTVSVTGAIDGRTERVDLSPKVSGMNESELAEEIIALADLARIKGLAGQHTYLVENEFLSEWMSEFGLAGDEVREFVESGMGLPTPAQADEAQAEVFANRYADDHD